MNNEDIVEEVIKNVYPEYLTKKEILLKIDSDIDLKKLKINKILTKLKNHGCIKLQLVGYQGYNGDPLYAYKYIKEDE